MSKSPWRLYSLVQWLKYTGQLGESYPLLELWLFPILELSLFLWGGYVLLFMLLELSHFPPSPPPPSLPPTPCVQIFFELQAILCPQSPNAVTKHIVVTWYIISELPTEQHHTSWLREFTQGHSFQYSGNWSSRRPKGHPSLVQLPCWKKSHSEWVRFSVTLGKLN